MISALDVAEYFRTRLQVKRNLLEKIHPDKEFARAKIQAYAEMISELDDMIDLVRPAPTLVVDGITKTIPDVYP